MKVNHLYLLFFCHFITVLSSCKTCTTDTETHSCLQQSTRVWLLQPPGRSFDIVLLLRSTAQV